MLCAYTVKGIPVYILIRLFVEAIINTQIEMSDPTIKSLQIGTLSFIYT